MGDEYDMFGGTAFKFKKQTNKQTKIRDTLDQRCEPRMQRLYLTFFC